MDWATYSNKLPESHKGNISYWTPQYTHYFWVCSCKFSVSENHEQLLLLDNTRQLLSLQVFSKQQGKKTEIQGRTAIFKICSAPLPHFCKSEIPDHYKRYLVKAESDWPNGFFLRHYFLYWLLRSREKIVQQSDSSSLKQDHRFSSRNTVNPPDIWRHLETSSPPTEENALAQFKRSTKMDYLDSPTTQHGKCGAFETLTSDSYSEGNHMQTL